MDLKGINGKIFNNFTQDTTIHNACDAFSDDTIWLGNSKTNLQKTINISNSFYRLNDIEINGDKSELLYIGTKKKVSIRETTNNNNDDHINPYLVKMGKNNTTVHASK